MVDPVSFANCDECGQLVRYDPVLDVTVDADDPEMEHECNPEDES